MIMQQNVTVHRILAHSYLMYFLASMVGLFADSFLSLDFQFPFATVSAIICFLLGPVIMAWAQYTSWKCKKNGCDERYFHHGPYRYMRNPTHLGLLILITGYTLVSGSVIFFLVSLLGYLISNIFFKKYESILQDTYGADYETYKASVKKVL
jgi:protein-S-isoprenylcysteine O-methyltransferase Ste14